MRLQDLARAIPVQVDGLETEDQEAEKARCFRLRLPPEAEVQRPERVKAETCGERQRNPGAAEQGAAGELLDRGEEVGGTLLVITLFLFLIYQAIIQHHITMTEVHHATDLVEAELQVEEVGLLVDQEVGLQEVQEVALLAAVQEVVLLPVLEEELLRIGEQEVTGGRQEDITEMLRRCMMSEHVYCNC